MKKILFLLCLIGGAVLNANAQWTTSGTNAYFNLTGNVGIGTTTPSSYFHGGTNKVLEIFNSNTTLNSQSHVILSTGSTLDGSSGGTLSWVSKNSTSNQGMAYIASQLQGSASTNAAANLVFGVSSGSGIVSKMVLDKNGNLGVGILTPFSTLHVVGAGGGLDGSNSSPIIGGGFAVQANPGSRSTTTGALLEFAIPANTDGSNVWGQGRIVTVAGTTNSGDATGKMIIGTRRSFNKLGTGAQWYYGNDIVIDGAGNVGIGTLTPREALSVNGSIRSKEVIVETVNWPDYVFAPSYALPGLNDVKTYIDKNHHLPGLPSAAEIEAQGLRLGEINKMLTKQIEELTLYLIDADRKLSEEGRKNDSQEQRIKTLEAKLDLLLQQAKK